MRLRLGLLLTLGVAALPAVASAEPAFTGTLSGASPTFTWEGAGNGVSDPVGLGVPGCGDPGHDCQDILLNVEEAGDLTITVDSDGNVSVSEPTGEFGELGSFQDIDTYLYPSDAAGEIKGDSMSEESATTSGDETFTVKALQPGYYLLRQEVFLGLEASWTGKAELTNVAPKPAAVEVPAAPAVEPAPAPAPAASQPPAQTEPAAQTQAPAKKKKKASKKAACKKKAKKIKNRGKRKKALKKCAKRKR